MNDVLKCFLLLPSKAVDHKILGRKAYSLLNFRHGLTCFKRVKLCRVKPNLSTVKWQKKNSLTLRKRLKYIYFIFGRPFLDFSQLEALC